MEEIISELEHTIEYFKDAQTDFQRGRVFEAQKILQALRIHDVVGRSEQLCPRCKSPLIYKRVHTDGYSCNNCFHDWA